MNKRKKTLFFVGLGSLGISLVLVIFILISIDRCKNYQCLEFPGEKSWYVKDVYEDSTNAWRGLINTPGYMIKLTVVPNTDAAQASLLNKTQLMGINQIYADARSPYPGEISDRISCQDKYKPHLQHMTTSSGIPLTYYTDYLNSSFADGVCVDDAIAYKGYTALFYCASTKQWYQMELIIDKNTKEPDAYYSNLFSQIACR